MGRLLPFKSEPTRTPDEPRVLDLDDEATEDALAALSSDTARQILGTLYEEPKTPPEIRDEVGTSLQNVHYHVERLEDAELIKSAGEGYSEKGTEMTIYAPASEALVLFAGREHDRSRLKTALTRLLGAVGLLAVASLVVRRLFGETGGRLGTYDISVGMGSSGDSGEPQSRGDGGDGGAGGSDGADGGGGGVGDGGDGADAGDGAEELTETPTPEDDVGIFGGVETGTDAAGATPTSEPTLTATQEPTVAPSASPTPAGTPSPTPAGTASPTPAGTPAPTPAGTPSPTATAPPTDSPTPTPAPEAMDTPTATEPPSPTPDPTGMESGTASPATDPNLSAQTVDAARQVSEGGDGFLADPAVAFFLGGLFMILVVTVWWYYQG
ncbi:helix-turn-helix domain-containing protein [Halosimplex amylolyticum]|uniref:ArsR/SmtB family transcription factor n=1 Tax=Halosimplex amylolyticum TaxID=3396616 RepID=UPI003F5583AC